MKSLLVRSLAAGAGLAAAGVLTATTAFAAPSAAAATDYTLAPGGAISAVNSGNLVFTDQTSSSKPMLTCTGFKGSGAANAGGHAFVPATYPGSVTGLDAAGQLTSESLSGCTNKTVGATNVTTSGTWYLGISKKTPTITGYLYNVNAHVAAASGTCQFDVVNGAVYGTYSNSTGIFSGSTTAGLKVSNVTGTSCPLVGIHNGDNASLAGQVKITPLQTIS